MRAPAPGSYRPVSGLGGVRALAGLGCGCAQQPSTQGMGAMMDVVKNPIFLGIAAAVLVGGFIVIREGMRW